MAYALKLMYQTYQIYNNINNNYSPKLNQTNSGALTNCRILNDWLYGTNNCIHGTEMIIQFLQLFILYIAIDNLLLGLRPTLNLFLIITWPETNIQIRIFAMLISDTALANYVISIINILCGEYYSFGKYN
eukprot:367435_1